MLLKISNTYSSKKLHINKQKLDKSLIYKSSELKINRTASWTIKNDLNKLWYTHAETPLRNKEEWTIYIYNSLGAAWGNDSVKILCRRSVHHRTAFTTSERKMKARRTMYHQSSWSREAMGRGWSGVKHSGEPRWKWAFPSSRYRDRGLLWLGL